MVKILEDLPEEIKNIVLEVVELENLHLHELRPRLTEEIQRIIINGIK